MIRPLGLRNRIGQEDLRSALEAATSTSLQDSDSLTNRILTDEMFNDSKSPDENELLNSSHNDIFVSSTNKNTDNKNQDKEITEKLEVEFSIETMDLLETFFGDGKFDETPTKFKIPYWVGECLYRAAKNLPIPEYFHQIQVEETFENSTVDEDASFALALSLTEDEEERLKAIELERQRLEQEQKKKNAESIFTLGHRNLASAENMQPESRAVNELYAHFPDMARDIIKKIARDCNYNVAEASKGIRNFRGIIKSEISKTAFKCYDYGDFAYGKAPPFLQQNKESFEGAFTEKTIFSKNESSYIKIVPSMQPEPIYQNERQHSPEANAKKFPQRMYIDEKGADIVTTEDVQMLRDEADAINYKIMDYKELICNNPRLGWHYQGMINDCESQKLRLYEQSDLMEIFVDRKKNSIDLHGKDPPRAIRAVVNKINFAFENIPHKKLQIITGRGKTTGGPPILREKVLKFLRERKISANVVEGNEGAIEINMDSVRDYINDYI